MEISYSQCGDYLIPNLVLPEEEQHTIGKYGRMRKYKLFVFLTRLLPTKVLTDLVGEIYAK